MIGGGRGWHRGMKAWHALPPSPLQLQGSRSARKVQGCNFPLLQNTRRTFASFKASTARNAMRPRGPGSAGTSKENLTWPVAVGRETVVALGMFPLMAISLSTVANYKQVSCNRLRRAVFLVSHQGALR